MPGAAAGIGIMAATNLATDIFLPGEDPSTSQESSVAPWLPAQGPIKQVLEGATDYYNQGPVELSKDPYLAAYDPLKAQAETGLMQYLQGAEGIADVGGARARGFMENAYGEAGQYTQDRPDMMSDAGKNAVSQLYGGVDEQGTADWVNRYRKDAINKYYTDVNPYTNAEITASQEGGGSRSQLFQNQRWDNTVESIEYQAGNMYLDAERLGSQNKALALGQELNYGQLGAQVQNQYAQQGGQNYLTGMQGYGNISQTQAANQANMFGYGAERQHYAQQETDEARFREDYEQRKDYYALEDYLALVGQPFGQESSGTSTYNDGINDTASFINSGAGLISAGIGGMA